MTALIISSIRPSDIGAVIALSVIIAVLLVGSGVVVL